MKNRWSLRNNHLSEFKAAGELPIVLEEYMQEYTPVSIKEN
jgi:hypothetical protein